MIFYPCVRSDFWLLTNRLLLIMKLALFLTLITVLQATAEGMAQTITLHAKNQPLSRVMNQIKKQSGYHFFLTGQQLAKVKVNADIQEASLHEAMHTLTRNLGVEWVIKDKVIVLRTAPPRPDRATPVATAAQERVVTGYVRDEQGAPLEGVTVAIDGSAGVVTTDGDGYYRIVLPEGASSLVFSYVGYQSTQQTISSRQTIDVRMQAAVSDLDEVVIVGYGTVRRGDLTGAISSVKGGELTAYPTNGVAQSLLGKAAGVNVTQNSGAPGAQMQVRIRGTNSIYGSNEPLWIIDGFPGDQEMINVSDVERIEILKDASATAIYGSRGANGVVLVTTKKGISGTAKVEVNSNVAFNGIRKRLELMNAREYGELYNIYWNNTQGSDYFSPEEINDFGKGTDWQDMILRQATMTDNSLNISGGNEKTTFSIGASSLGNQGIIRNSDYKRALLRGSITHNLNKFVSVSANALLSRINENPTADNLSLMLGALSAAPTVGPYNADGSYRMLGEDYPFSPTDIINPQAFLNERSNKQRSNNMMANVALTVKPIEGLSVKFSGNVNNADTKGENYVGVNYPTSTGSASLSSGNRLYISSENVVNYETQFDRHKFNALAGFTYENSKSTSFGASGSGFFSDVTGTADLGSATTLGIPYSSYQDWTLMSYLARLNYNFSEKYLATVSIRADGSSRYSANNKWGYFPSAALAWRFSEEAFFDRFSFISDGKIRIGYGVTGSTSIDPYYTLNMLSSGKALFEDGLYTFFAPGTRLPSDLKWESTHQTDVGLDLSLFDNRLSLTADYYYKITKDLLNTVQLPRSMGYTSTVKNIGSIENKGFEFMANAIILDGNLKWQAGATMSFNRNKVLKLNEGQDINGSVYNLIVANDYVNVLREGHAMSKFYGYVYDGFDDEGRYTYKDLNGDGAVNSNDKTWIGDPNPDFIFGFTSDLSYRNWELSLFIQGSQGNDIFGFGMISQNYRYYVGFNGLKDVLYDHWTPSNPDATYPRIDDVFSTRMSDRFVYDGSYLRVKNVRLAYNLPVSNLAWINQAKLYVSGQNLLTLTKYPWWDPEVNSYGSGNSINQGIDYYSYPVSKGVTMGVTLVF